MTCLEYMIGISYPVNIIFCMINIACAMVSIVGNSLTIWVIAKKHHLHVPRNLLLAALSMSDLVAGLISQPVYGIYLSFGYKASNCIVEKGLVFISAASCTSSLLLVTAIARDRWLHVAKSHEYNMYTSKRQVGFSFCQEIKPLNWVSSTRVNYSYMPGVEVQNPDCKKLIECYCVVL